MGESHESLLKAVRHYQQGLDKYTENRNDAKLLHYLDKLFKLPIKVVHLEQTGVGRTVNGLRKLGGDVGNSAKSLVAKWKEMVVGEAEEEEEDDDEDDDDEDEEDGYQSGEEQEHSNESGEEEELENEVKEIEERSSSSHRSSDRTENRTEIKENHKKEKHSSSSSRSEEGSHKHHHHHHHSESEKEKSRDSSKRDKHEHQKSSNGHSEKNKLHKRKLEVEPEPEIKHHKKKKEDRNEDERNHKSKRRIESDSDSDGQRKKSRESDYDDSSKNKIKSKHRDSSQKETKEKVKDKEKSSSRKDESSKSENKKHDHSKKSKDHDKDRKDKDRKSSNGASSSKPKDSNKDSKSKENKKDEHRKSKSHKSADKPHTLTGIDSGSGASFAEALGMCEPSSSKGSVKKKSLVPEKKEKTVNKDEDSVPKLLKDANLDPIDINLSSLLPTITPNYRPLGNLMLDSQPKRNFLSESEALCNVMTSKNQRTKVYSGNKILFGKVPTLFEMCIRILQDNIDALEYTGGVPYSVLKPILDKATPNQLFILEHHNPYLIEDTDDLWQLHCQKDFRNKPREELESWREMYMRCLDEREAKLRALTANIKQAQDKSLPVRTTKLAYVDDVAKPPRNIARKQAKNGTAFDHKRPSVTPSSRLSSLATAGEAGKVAVPNPGARAVERSSSQLVKPKKAPLMAKSLSLLKNRFRR